MLHMDSAHIKAELGLRIKNFRTENNLTQEQLSEIIELKPANISNIEKGKTYPGFSTICSLINKANIEPNYLLGFLRPENTPYNSSTLEIMNIITNLTPEQQQGLKIFLKTIV